MDEELFLPVLSHFENGNFWTASGGALRYKVVLTPQPVNRSVFSSS